MKLTTKIMAGTAALAFLTMAAGSLQAQVTNLVTITATASMQDTTSTDNGTVTTYNSPIVYSVTTVEILADLAVDENAEGKYGSPTFPPGAKLVAINIESEFYFYPSND